MQEPKRLNLATLPTPLVRLERLGRDHADAQIWMKRDDLTGLELSGNKVRKLEYVAADALSRGCDTLVTEGTCQSNHCRATAAVCAKLGLKSVLLVRPEPPDEVQGNHLLDALFGAQTRVFPAQRFAAEREQIVEAVISELEDAGQRPRWVPMGASEPLGCWGYIRAMAELTDQISTMGITACDVIVPVSSGGTYAGALLGSLLNKSEAVHLWGVPVSDDVDYHVREIGGLCRRTVEQFELPIEFDDSIMQFIDGYVGEGYAIPYEAAIQAIRLLARTEGIILDPVYTAKAFCSVLDGVQNGRLGRDRPVIFFHTGGIFSDFAWSDALLVDAG
ncbi:MAG: 1-aminocyclopropane-1-carboxylate deaminase/D-cysteine desulfhydrase [Planctomycetota bacterium]|jgi:D-cysteine desulfhydrase